MPPIFRNWGGVVTKNQLEFSPQSRTSGLALEKFLPWKYRPATLAARW
jgi:hypothetical protein